MVKPASRVIDKPDGTAMGRLRELCVVRSDGKDPDGELLATQFANVFFFLFPLLRFVFFQPDPRDAWHKGSHSNHKDGWIQSGSGTK